MSEPTTTTSPMAERSPHPLSEIFPRMEDAGLAALAEDIKDSRLKEPIWLFEDKILDGNNRYRACLKISYRFKETDFRQFDPKTQGDPLTFVVSANLHRRHLNESQRAAIAATLVTTKLGYNRYSRAVQSGITNAAAANLLGVSEATVKMAKAVADKAAPEIFEKVQKGELRLGAVSRVVRKPKSQQAAELAKIEAKNEERKVAAKAAAEAAKATRAANAPKNEPAANQKMTALDDFKAKWVGFDEMQRKAFVMTFEEDLAGLLEYVRQQKAMIGGATANVGS